MGAEFWQETMQEFIAFDAARGKNKGALTANEVNKTHYVKDGTRSQYDNSAITMRVNRYEPTGEPMGSFRIRWPVAA